MQIHPSYGTQKFDDEECFLCGAKLSGGSSDEHVFPKWLQRKYNLWSQKIDLLNGTSIQYKNLLIPCCEECNNEHLSAIENEVSRAVTSGYDSALNVSPRVWYLWAGKMFYGILRKELSLLIDQRNPRNGTIVSRNTLKSFSNLHLFLQGARDRHQFRGDVPFTVLVLNLHDTNDEFDFRDNFVSFSLSIRMGEVGVIVSFEDGGLIRETYGRYVRDVAGRKLHPIQFAELYAKVSYQLSLRQRPLTFFTDSHVDGERIASTRMINASTLFDEWDQEQFAEILRFHLRSWLSDSMQVIYQSPDLLSTWMIDSDGELLILPLDKW